LRLDMVGMSAAGAGTRAALLPAQAGPTITLILLAPVAPAIADYFGPEGTSAAQQVVTFPFLGLMLGSLLSGPAIRLVGLKQLALAASVAFIVSGAIGIVAGGLPLLLFGGIVLGLGAGWLTSALSGITSVLLDGDERARLVGLQSALGNLIGAALGLFTAMLAGGLGWRTPFGAFLFFGVATFLLAILFIPRMSRAGSAVNDRLMPVLARTWPVCLAGCAVFAIAANQSTNLPFLLAQNGITSTALRALVTITTSTAAMFGSLGYAAAQGKLNDRGMVVVAGTAGALGWLIFAYWVGGLSVAIFAAALIGIGIGIVMPILFTNSMRAVANEASGAAVGLLSASVFFGSFISAALFAPLRVWAGLSGMMLWVAVATVAIAAIAFVWPRAAVPQNSEPA
jgi:predicted MFS family arabinose efflux permease